MLSSCNAIKSAYLYFTSSFEYFPEFSYCLAKYREWDAYAQLTVSLVLETHYAHFELAFTL